MEKALDILKIIAAVATILTGFLSLVRPAAVYEFTGLRADSGRGVTEIRSILGALFIALGIMVLYFRIPQTYQMLGVMYLTIAVVRFVSMFIDKSVVKSNVISLVTEIVLGVILVL